MNDNKPIKDYVPCQFQKYFPLVFPYSIIREGVEINEEQLREILKEYNLITHFELFRDLANWLPVYFHIVDYNKEFNKEVDEWHNQKMDLIEISKALKKDKIGWIEIKSNIGDKIKISDNSLLGRLGEIIFDEYYKKAIKSGMPKEKKFWTKNSKQTGKPNQKRDLAMLCYMLLNFLNNETTLKSKDKFLSNEQGRFIFDYLEFTKAINEDTSKYLQEDYIRTLMNNYKYIPDYLAEQLNLFVSCNLKPLKK